MFSTTIMRFRQRIALVFTLLTALIFLMIGLMMYFVTARLTREEFFVRLKLRSEIAAKARFEENKQSNDIYQSLREQHLAVLPDEKEYFVKVNPDGTLQERRLKELPLTLLDRIIKKGYGEFSDSGIYYAGILYRSHESNYLVVVSATDPVGHQDMNRLKTILLFSFVLTSILSLIIGNWFSNQFINPLSKMVAKVNNISAHNLDLRLDPAKKGKGELAELAQTFNDMLDRLETAFQIQNNFVSNASHELRTPLTAVLSATELALMEPEKNHTETLLLIQKQAGRLNDIINGLLKLAQSGYNSKKQLTDEIRLDELILSILDDLNVTHPGHQVKIDFSEMPDSPQDLTVLGTEPLLRLAINNIFQNAIKYSDNKEVKVKLFLDQNRICLHTSDQGIGIPKPDLEHIFELFFRASNHGNRIGFGLGLPLSYRIFKVHHAQLDIRSEEGKGTDVYVCFNKAS